MDKSFVSKQTRTSGWLEWGDPESFGSPVSFSDAVSGPGSHDDTGRLGADGGVLVGSPAEGWSMGCGDHAQLALEGIGYQQIQLS